MTDYLLLSLEIIFVGVVPLLALASLVLASIATGVHGFCSALAALLGGAGWGIFCVFVCALLYISLKSELLTGVILYGGLISSGCFCGSIALKGLKQNKNVLMWAGLCGMSALYFFWGFFAGLVYFGYTP